jgi:hypothetical protein
MSIRSKSRHSKRHRLQQILGILLIVGVSVLAIKLPPMGLQLLLPNHDITMSAPANPCPHSAPAQTQCQTKQSSEFKTHDEALFVTQNELIYLLLFVLTLFAIKQAPIDSLYKPPRPISY